MDKFITIERHIIEQEKHSPGATGAFSNLLYDIATSAKLIGREVRRAGLTNILGMFGRENVQGEQQMKLDVFAEEMILRMNEYTGRLGAMASEESEDLIHVRNAHGEGKYILLFDPLDGSSNIDVNGTVGTIFGIHRRLSHDGDVTMEDALQPGSVMAGAGYVIYGPSVMLVYTTGNGAHGFTLDPTLGEFLLSHPNIQIPQKPKYYSVNQSNWPKWTEGVKQYTQWLSGRHPTEPSNTLSARYVGSLVADFHRNLLHGGVYYYPADAKDGKGKLRLLYECAPLALIAQQAGGYASDGRRDILSVAPDSLHMRTQVFIGNRDLVEKAEHFIGRCDKT